MRAISGSVLAAQILQALNTTVSTPPLKASGLKLTVQFGAYASFMSFFGLAGLPAASPDFEGIVDYASAFVLELATNASVSATAPVNPADVAVRFLFSNGSAAAGPGLQPFPLFATGLPALAWPDFASRMAAIAVGDTADWCRVCGNSTGICSPALLGTAGTGNNGGGSGGAGDSGSGGGDGGVSAPVAGVIGALVTLAVILGVEGLVMLVAGLRVVKKGVAAGAKGGSPEPTVAS